MSNNYELPTLPAGSDEYVFIDVVKGTTTLMLFGISADKRTFRHESTDDGYTWTEAEEMPENGSL